MTLELLERELPETAASGDDVQQYLREIRRYPLLSAEEERALARRCADGDTEAIRQMVNSNLRLVVSIAGEYAGRGVPMLDLIQEGSIGLLAAARKFDHSLDYRFSTYATKWIRQGVSRCVLNHSTLIRVPVYTAERIRKVQQSRAALLQQLQQEPSAVQIAAHCGLSPEKVEQYLLLSPEICSLDAPAGENEETPLSVMLEDRVSPQPYEELVRDALNQNMSVLLQALDQRQQQILRLHFGMEDGICYSLEEISKRLGISKERTRQIERQAMDKLQRLGASMGLEDFLE